jgi:HEAT repeat protein
MGMKGEAKGILAVYWKGDARQQTAYTALVLLGDEGILPELLEAIEKDPKVVIKVGGLFQGPLAGKKAEPGLLKLLSSEDVAVKVAAAQALEECVDEALAGPAVKLAEDDDLNVKVMAVRLGRKLPAEAWARVSEELEGCLLAREPVRSEAVACYAEHKDARAAPVMLAMMKLETLEEGSKVVVMQSLVKLTGTQFGYNMHEWGPKKNLAAIQKFDAWVKGRP